MDDALPGAIDVATKKARTAALFRTDSADLGVRAQPGGDIYSLEGTNGGLIREKVALQQLPKTKADLRKTARMRS